MWASTLMPAGVVLSADCTRPAVVWCTPAAVGERVIEPLGEPGGLGRSLAGLLVSATDSGCSGAAAYNRKYAVCEAWTVARLAQRAVAPCINNSSSSGAWMYCTAVG